jgi:hypothetical protein
MLDAPEDRSMFARLPSFSNVIFALGTGVVAILIFVGILLVLGDVGELLLFGLRQILAYFA